MVPYGLSQEQFKSMYARKLDRLSNQAIRCFRDLLDVPIGLGVDHARIEVFTDEYGGAPAVWAYWRGKNNKVDSADRTLFPGRSLQLDLDLRDLGDIDEQYFVEPDEFPGLQLTVSLLLRWLAEAWWKAGGWTYPVPTVLAIHDFESHGHVQLSSGGT